MKNTKNHVFLSSMKQQLTSELILCPKICFPKGLVLLQIILIKFLKWSFCKRKAKNYLGRQYKKSSKRIQFPKLIHLWKVFPMGCINTSISLLEICTVNVIKIISLQSNGGSQKPWLHFLTHLTPTSTSTPSHSLELHHHHPNAVLSQNTPFLKLSWTKLSHMMPGNTTCNISATVMTFQFFRKESYYKLSLLLPDIAAISASNIHGHL